MELGRTDVIEGCEVAEEKREKRVLIGFRTTEKGYRPLRDPCPTCLASNAIQRSSSSRARTIREREQDDTLSFPRILSFANPTMRKISGKKIWLFRVKKKESFPLEIVSHFLSFLGFIFAALWSWILYLPSSKKTVRLRWTEGDSFHFVSESNSASTGRKVSKGIVRWRRWRNKKKKKKKKKRKKKYETRGRRKVYL